MLENQMIRYMLVGATTFFIDLSIFKSLLDYAAYDCRIALLISFFFSVLINFLLCDLFVFHRTLPLKWAIMRHYIANTSSLLIQISLLTLFISLFHSNAIVLTRICIACCTFVLNFFIGKKLTFNEL